MAERANTSVTVLVAAVGALAIRRGIHVPALDSSVAFAPLPPVWALERWVVHGGTQGHL